MIRIRLSQDDAKRLELAAKRVGKSKTALAQEAVIRKMGELEAEYFLEYQRPRRGHSSKNP